jgi:ABC-type transport system involved in multi-copper enzyme maturation permease subunit
VRSIFDTFSRGQFVLATLVASMAFSRAICREQERGTMDLLILCPLTRTEILAGKLAGEFLGLTALVASGIPILFLMIPLGGISALQVLAIQTTLLAHVLVVGGVCVALASMIGRTLPVMICAWIVVTVFSGGLWAGKWLFPRSTAVWHFWESVSPYSILDSQLIGILPQPMVSLQALGIAAIAAILLCGLGSLLVERRHVQGRRIGLFASLAIRMRRVQGRPLFRPLFRFSHPLLRRELSFDRDIAFRVAWVGLVAAYGAACRVILTWPWAQGEYHIVLAMIGLAIAAAIAAVVGAITVGYERRRGVFQTLLAAGVSPEAIVRSRTAGLAFRTAALLALSAAHLIWIGAYVHVFPASETAWRIPISIVAVVFSVLCVAQVTLQLALKSPRPEIAAVVAALLAAPAMASVAALTGATLGTFSLAVPACIATAVTTHARMAAKLPRWVLS